MDMKILQIGLAEKQFLRLTTVNVFYKFILSFSSLKDRIPAKNLKQLIAFFFCISCQQAHVFFYGQ